MFKKVLLVMTQCLVHLRTYVQVDCSMSESTSLPSPKENAKPLCTVASDKTGQFILYPLPPGAYSVVSFCLR